MVQPQQYVDSLYSEQHYTLHPQPLDFVLPVPEQAALIYPTALFKEPQEQQDVIVLPKFSPTQFITTNLQRKTAPIARKPSAPSSPRVLSDLGDGQLYEATYSGSDVYEMAIGGHSVMRRRDDSWINATHILKVAGVEKGRRTKILEKEVHHEPHEKIQGGFGKYQGTWVPLERAKSLAVAFGVADHLSPILNL